MISGTRIGERLVGLHISFWVGPRRLLLPRPLLVLRNLQAEIDSGVGKGGCDSPVDRPSPLCGRGK